MISSSKASEPTTKRTGQSCSWGVSKNLSVRGSSIATHRSLSSGYTRISAPLPLAPLAWPATVPSLRRNASKTSQLFQIHSEQSATLNTYVLHWALRSDEPGIRNPRHTELGSQH